MPIKSESLAVAFATIARPQVTQRLICSIRRFFPEIPIYVADQSLCVAAMESFYRHMRVTVVRMPFDSGVCASRNRLVSEITEDFFVLCDDDFVFGAQTSFNEALRVLRHHPEIGVVGGKLLDFDGHTEWVRHWELLLSLDTINRTLTATPIYNYAPRTIELGRSRFYRTDTALNFAVMRRSMFDDTQIRWDERFKSNGEHEDFYLNLKLNSEVRVLYSPTMVAYHHHPVALSAYRTRLRERTEGWKKFFAKWGIDQHLEMGLGVRTVGNLDQIVPTNDAVWRFFLNESLSLERDSESPAVLIGRDNHLTVVGSADTPPNLNPPTGSVARLLIKPLGGTVMAAPDVATPKALEFETPEVRHALSPAVRPLETATSAPLVLFRYDPIAHSETDFLIWYRANGDTLPQQRLETPADGLAVTVRWYGDNGEVLLWEGSHEALDLSRTEYWSPLLIEVPVRPSTCTFMRFDVVAGSNAGFQLLASGFLFTPARRRRGVDLGDAALAFDACALSAWRSGAVSRLPLTNLATLRCPAASAGLAPIMSAQVPSLMLLPLAPLHEYDMAFFCATVGWGAPLSTLPLHAGIEFLALPSQLAGDIRLVVLTRERTYLEVPMTAPAHASATRSQLNLAVT